jgi:hypothetical protein
MSPRAFQSSIICSRCSRGAGFELALELAPGDAEAEVAKPAALGEAFAGLLRADGAHGHGSAFLPADEALAQVALEVSERPLVASNVDLTEARAGGLGARGRGRPRAVRGSGGVDASRPADRR